MDRTIYNCILYRWQKGSAKIKRVNIFNYFAEAGKDQTVKEIIMRKIQLVEMGIIATVLLMGYKMITSLLALITTLLFGLGGDINRNILMAILPTVLFFAFYTITFFLLARNVKRVARFICGNTDETLEFKLSKISVLHVIIIAICLSSFLQTIPDLVLYVVNRIADPGESGGNYELREWQNGKIKFWSSLTGFVLALILLLASKNIASFFGKDEHSFEIGGEKIDDNA